MLLMSISDGSTPCPNGRPDKSVVTNGDRPDSVLSVDNLLLVNNWTLGFVGESLGDKLATLEFCWTLAVVECCCRCGCDSWCCWLWWWTGDTASDGKGTSLLIELFGRELEAIVVVEGEVK